jgi:hypothetical protein
MRYIELETIVVCAQSDGYLKAWAEKELKKLDTIYKCKVK